MKFTVQADVLNKTTKCSYKFSCLENDYCGEHPLCEVDYADGKDILFLKTKESYNCNYCMPFGYRQLCTCPTHYVINQQKKS